jgi:hypothetical protein
MTVENLRDERATPARPWLLLEKHLMAIPIVFTEVREVLMSSRE